MSLFSKPPTTNRKLKLLIYGGTGTWKTRSALQMPKPAVIDMEKGTIHYTEEFDFESSVTTDIRKVHKAVEEIVNDPQDFKTIVLDSASMYWDFLQETHLKRLRVKKGDSTYTLQPLDYKAIKADTKSISTKLLDVDLNVVVTARDKVEYSSDTSSGDFMKVIGTKPECPKDWPFIFDTVIELTKHRDGRITAHVIKDRTNKLPDDFDYSFEALETYFGKDVIYRDVDTAAGQRALAQSGNRDFVTKLNGKDKLTAGITGENIVKIQNLKTLLGDDQLLTSKLNEDYAVSSVLDLKDDEAELLIVDLNQMITDKEEDDA